MTGKPITWDEIDEIFSRCGEVHVSPNIAQAIEAQRATDSEAGTVADESAVRDSECAQGEQS
jgi:16S rRNA C1402 N4-methylase RsmH